MTSVGSTQISEDIVEKLREECTQSLSAAHGTVTRIWFDVSASMGGKNIHRWNDQRTIIKNILPIAMMYSPKEVTLIPIYSPTALENGPSVLEGFTDVTSAMEYIDSWGVRLRPSTPTRRSYNEWIQKCVEECVKSPHTKRSNNIIVTDGVPTDKHEPSLTATTNWAISELIRHKLDPKRYLGVSFVILNDELSVMASYNKLDNRGEWGNEDQHEEDITNAIYPFSIKNLGGPQTGAVTSIILGGASSTTCDTAAEELQSGSAADITRLMTAFAEAGHVEEI